eukprot:7216297-Pyramimonas_sp.AAC.1
MAVGYSHQVSRLALCEPWMGAYPDPQTSSERWAEVLSKHADFILSGWIVAFPNACVDEAAMKFQSSFQRVAGGLHNTFGC